MGGDVGGGVGGFRGGGQARVGMHAVCSLFTEEPCIHLLHVDAFSLEYSPAGHFKQLKCVVVYCPAGHDWHSVEPNVDQVPVGHTRHVPELDQ